MSAGRQQGELVDWNDEAGYGFIRSAGGTRLFVHANSFVRREPRPQAGDQVSFVKGAGREGRPAAFEAQIEVEAAEPAAAPSARKREADPVVPVRFVIRLVGAVVFALLLAFVVTTGRPPVLVAWLYAAMSLVTFAAYALDKSAARRGAWRVPESRLHLLDLCFGIIGGLLAQALLRHKTSKPGFTGTTAAVALLHGIALAAVAFGYISLPRLG